MTRSLGHPSAALRAAQKSLHQVNKRPAPHLGRNPSWEAFCPDLLPESLGKDLRAVCQANPVDLQTWPHPVLRQALGFMGIHDIEVVRAGGSLAVNLGKARLAGPSRNTNPRLPGPERQGHGIVLNMLQPLVELTKHAWQLRMSSRRWATAVTPWVPGDGRERKYLHTRRPVLGSAGQLPIRIYSQVPRVAIASTRP